MSARTNGRQWLLPLAALTCVVAFWWLVRGRDRQQAEPSVPAGATSPQDSPNSAPGIIDPSASRIPTSGLELEPDALTADVSTLAGRVLDGHTGRGIADARVVVLALASDDLGSAASVTTGVDGAFAFGWLKPGAYSVRVEAQGYALHLVRQFRLHPGESGALEVQLWRGQLLEVEVVDATLGAPLQGAGVLLVAGSRDASSESPAFVELLGRRALTDAAGRARFESVADGIQRVAASADGFASATAELTMSDAPQRVRIELSSSGAIEGRVLVPDGVAPSEVYVVIAPEQVNSRVWRRVMYPADIVRTDEQGRYRIPSVPAGRHRLLAATTSGNAVLSAGAVDVRAGETQRVELTLDAAGSVALQVVDEVGVGIAGATVELRREDLRKAGWFQEHIEPNLRGLAPRLTTDADGWARFESVRCGTGPLTFAAVAEGCTEETVELSPSPATGIDARVTLSRRSGTIRGTVRDESGQPLGGMSVVASEYRGARYHGFYSAVTGERGEFSLSVPVGDHRFAVRLSLRKAAAVSTPEKHDELRSGATGVDFVVRHLQRITGRVESLEDSRPVGEFQVALFDDDRQGFSRSISFRDPAGRFDIGVDPERDTMFGVSAAGFLPSAVVDLARPSNEEFVVRLRRGGTLRGRVLAQDGTPVPRAVVAIGTLDSSFLAPRSVLAPAARTDAAGAFEITGAPDDLGFSLVVCAGIPDAPSLVHLNQPPGNTDRDLVLRLPSAKSVHVTVASASGEDVRGRVYAVDRDGWRIDANAEPAIRRLLGANEADRHELVDGQCTLALAPGKYRLRFVASDSAPKRVEREIVVPEGGDEVRITLETP